MSTFDDVIRMLEKISISNRDTICEWKGVEWPARVIDLDGIQIRASAERNSPTLYLMLMQTERELEISEFGEDDLDAFIASLPRTISTRLSKI